MRSSALLFLLLALLPFSATAQVADTVRITVVDTTMVSVSLGPIGDTVALPAQIQLQPTVLNASGQAVVPDSLVWTSLAPAVATVSATGLVTFLAPGQASITVQAFRGSEVPPPDPFVPPPSGDPEPAWEQDWSFSSMTALRADPEYSDSGTADDNMTVLQGLSTPWGGSTAVRRPGNAGYNSVGINWDWPAASAAHAREVWVEIWLRFAATWRVVSVPEQSTDDKTIFWLPNTSVRWEAKFINNVARLYINNSPVPGGHNVPIPEGDVADGQWHRFRVHLRMGTGDGAYEAWWDDTKFLTATGLSTGNAASDYWAWHALGRNCGLASASWMDFGRERMWLTDPGW